MQNRGILLLEQFAIICNILEMVLKNDTNFTTINLKSYLNNIFDSFLYLIYRQNFYRIFIFC